MKLDYKPVGTVGIDGRVVGGVLLAAVAVAGIGFGGYEAGWWFKTNNVNRSAQINLNSLGSQESKITEVTKKLESLSSLKALDKAPDTTAEQIAANKVQEKAIENSICDSWVKITPSYRASMDTDMVNTVSAMCATNLNINN